MNGDSRWKVGMCVLGVCVCVCAHRDEQSMTSCFTHTMSLTHTHIYVFLKAQTFSHFPPALAHLSYVFPTSAAI